MAYRHVRSTLNLQRDQIVYVVVTNCKRLECHQSDVSNAGSFDGAMNYALNGRFSNAVSGGNDFESKFSVFARCFLATLVSSWCSCAEWFVHQKLWAICYRWLMHMIVLVLLACRSLNNCSNHVHWYGLLIILPVNLLQKVVVYGVSHTSGVCRAGL
jgi:hypothetical protein